MAKKPDSGFIDSVPELVQKVRGFQFLTISNPALPFPWPRCVPDPEKLDDAIAYLEKVYLEIGDEKIRTGGKLGRARRYVKTRFSQLVGYAAATLQGDCDLERWPGFDLGRNHGENRCRTPYRSSSPAQRAQI